MDARLLWMHLLLTVGSLAVLEHLEGAESGSTTDQFVREFALMVGLVILNLLVVLLGIIYEDMLSVTSIDTSVTCG
jgi:hypothetical protein